MDDYDAPQWADFNASLMSDIDDYFMTEHKEHEPRYLDGTRYESFPDSPNSRASTAYNTPKSTNSFSSPMPSRNSRGSNLKSGENLIKIKTRVSSTPSSVRRMKIATNVENSMTNSITEEETEIFEKKKIDEKNLNILSTDNFVFPENLLEDNAENNRTLVANENEKQLSILEKSENFVDDGEKLEIRETEENLPISDCEIFNRGEDKSVHQIAEEEKLKLEKLEICVESSELPIFEKKKIDDNLPISSKLEIASEIFSNPKNNSEDKISQEDKSRIAKLESRLDPSRRSIPDKKKKIDDNLPISSNFQADPEIFSNPENKSMDKISAEEKLRLAKLESRLDPSRRSIFEKQKKIDDNLPISSKLHADPEIFSYPENKSMDKISPEDKLRLAELVTKLDPPKRAIIDKKNPTSRAPKARVLTSQVRRHSISKYRRRSTKYVSLAEAVSKFQNATPKRFRSTNPKDEKAGPLQKAKQTTMKLTCPISPALRSKLRARAISVPNAEEREKLQIEEIRKNRVRPNPIKTSATNLRTISSLTRSQSAPSGSKTLKKVFNKPSTFSAEMKSRINPPKTLPKSTISSDLKTADTLKASSKIEKIFSGDRKIVANTSKVFNATGASSEIKTGMNLSQVSTNILKKPSDLPISSSDQKSAMNNPRISTNVVKKSSDLPISSFDQKSAMNPPQISAKNLSIASSSQNLSTNIEKKSSTLCDSFSAAGRKLDTSLMSSSISHKHTPCKKMIPSVVSTEEDEIVIKPVEILYFGIPIDNDYKNKNITRTIPFSFDTRNKESQNKKDKIKSNQQIEEEKTKKTIFHARPAPSFVKTAAMTKTSSTLKTKEETGNKSNSLCPLSFQQRNDLLLQKKKKVLEEVVEKEKKARIFHAKPAPNFKPVFVRGASAENLRANGDKNSANNNKDRKSRGLSPAARQKGLSQDSIVSNQENKAPNFAGNLQCPKLKNPLMAQNLKIKKTGGK